MDAELIALATTAGTAVAQAVGTDAWHGFRTAAARLFRRGHAPEAEQQTALVRLDRTATDLANAQPEAAGQARTDIAASWRTRFQDLLADAPATDLPEIADQLRALIALAEQARGAATAGDNSIVIGGDTQVTASNNSVAGVNVTMGNVTFGNPLPPGPANG
ncbi:hypothetical protein ACFYNO_34980 [Kitasatospora sp. NPDC006697]|uniref:hypothetical protein n=1 Tax=Kitasatospora sp. NPDC006697 TaxID=3364020 RepID=UPI0036A8F179